MKHVTMYIKLIEHLKATYNDAFKEVPEEGEQIKLKTASGSNWWFKAKERQTCKTHNDNPVYHDCSKVLRWAIFDKHDNFLTYVHEHTKRTSKSRELTYKQRRGDNRTMYFDKYWTWPREGEDRIYRDLRYYADFIRISNSEGRLKLKKPKKPRRKTGDDSPDDSDEQPFSTSAWLTIAGAAIIIGVLWFKGTALLGSDDLLPDP